VGHNRRQHQQQRLDALAPGGRPAGALGPVGFAAGGVGGHRHRPPAIEDRILALVAEGHTNREIADQVFLSEKTVRNYVSAILGKLGLAHRSQAAAYAVEHGLLSRARP
jgi:DNA-binding CsgD family transcriptional regulator